ncbi:methionine/alanine import family NSS transporter small subunit [Microbacterium sp.]|uniref:methionine/alanine import family NSS transporter small subunit n=1 Tax=Microbacterium sp. TaxID=51671 RepID=UPI003A879C41
MTGIALTFLILALVVVWGGLLVSALFLARRPEVAAYPPGGDDEPRESVAPIEHDT